MPEATVTAEVDSVAPAEQAAVPMDPDPFTTVAVAQVALTAEAGMVVHPEENVEVPAATVSVQLLVVAPPLSLNTTEAAADPEKVPRSGSVAEKLMELGDAVSEVMLVTAGAT